MDIRIVLDKKYIQALAGLDEFSHIHVLWWFSECDNVTDRNRMAEYRPYREGPDVLGTFATRSPRRPNPLALDCGQITCIDHENAVIGVTWLCAFNGSPVLDIKPCTPALDRVESPVVPAWCRHCPASYEKSADVDRESVMAE